MVVGICTMELYLGEAICLKDKRRVLKSIIDRVKAHHNVSIAEIDQQDLWQRSTIAFTCVSNESEHAFKMLNSVVKFIEKQNQSQLIDYKIELI